MTAAQVQYLLETYGLENLIGLSLDGSGPTMLEFDESHQLMGFDHVNEIVMVKELMPPTDRYMLTAIPYSTIFAMSWRTTEKYEVKS